LKYSGGQSYYVAPAMRGTSVVPGVRANAHKNRLFWANVRGK